MIRGASVYPFDVKFIVGSTTPYEAHFESDRTTLINTGITPPVRRRNSRWPTRRSMEAIDPEWLVNDMYVLLS